MGFEKSIGRAGAQAAVAALVAAYQAEQPKKNIRTLVAPILERTFVGFTFSDEDQQMIAEEMIKQGFHEVAEDFVEALRSCLSMKSAEEWDTLQPTISQYLLPAITRLTASVQNSRHKDKDTVIASVCIAAMIDKANSGKAQRLVRLCGEKIDPKIVNNCAYSWISIYLSESLESARNLLAEGLIRRFGCWKTWRMVSTFCLGNNPDQAEAEMKKERQIEIVHAKLEGSWMHKIVIDSPTAQTIIDCESGLMDQLRKIDPEADNWIKKNAPESRLGSY